jgi:hypothetical protein
MRSGTGASGYRRRRGALAAVLALAVLVTGLLALASAPAGAAGCSDEFTGSSGGLWSVAGNWSTGLPTASSIVCFAGKTVVVSTGTQEAASIFEGGSLTVKGSGSLTLETAADPSTLSGTITVETTGKLRLKDSVAAVSLVVTEGDLEGGGSLALTGNFLWTGGKLGNSLTVSQTGKGSFEIGGGRVFFYEGAVIETESPVTISATEFLGAESSKLTTTSTVTLPATEYKPSVSTLVTTAGIITKGPTQVGFKLHLTGSASKLGGNLVVGGLTLDESQTLEVPEGVNLELGLDSESTISGTIEGKGSLTKGTGKSTILGSLAVPVVSVPEGELIIEPGAKYAASKSTTIDGGSMKLKTAGSTGSLSLGEDSNLEGSGSIDVTGNFDWTGGELEHMTVKQTGSGTCVIAGTGRVYLYAGSSLETESTIQISTPEFLTDENPTVMTTGKIQLAKGLDMSGGDGTFTASELGENEGSSYGFGTSDLVLTNAAHSGEPEWEVGEASIGQTLEAGKITLEGGELRADGTLKAAEVLLTGGKLIGRGTITGNVANAGGTVAPGFHEPGHQSLTIDGNFEQTSGALRTELESDGLDEVIVKGTAKLAGSVEPIDGEFTPTPHTKYRFLSVTGAKTGTFTGTVGPDAALYGLEYEPTAAYLLGKVAPPVNTELPKISGEPAAGQTLTCSDGKWTGSPTSYEIQWKLEGAAITGATGSGYVVPAADEGKQLSCTVTASNEGGAGAPATSAPVSVAVPIAPPEEKTPPTVSGPTEAGATLTCAPGTWTGSPSFTYQWSIEGASIAGATGATYVITTTDEGHSLTCTVTASDGATASATSAAVAVPRPSLQLSCSGRPIVLISVLQSGHSVVLTGFALAKYAGKKVTITISDVPKRYAKGKGGSTIVQPNGSFSAKLVLPKGKLAPLTRYTATVEGQASLGLKLGRNLVITSETPVAGGSKVSFRFVGPRGPGKGVVQFTRQESCTSNKIVATAKLTKANTLTVTLPAPAKAGETSYYRAQTRIAAGVTYSLPIAVTNG